MAGIKESREALQAVGALAAAFAQARKNGWDLSDFGVLLDSDLQNDVKVGVDGMNAIPGEISDLDLREVMQLFQTVVSEFEELR